MTKLIHQTAFTQTAAKAAQLDVDVANAEAVVKDAIQLRYMLGGETFLFSARQKLYEAKRARDEFKAAQQKG